MTKKYPYILLAVILAFLLGGRASLAADPVPGSADTDIIAFNTNQNPADPPAAMTAFYYDPEGVLKYQRAQNIASRGSYAFRTTDTLLGDGWQGSVVLEAADRYLATVADLTWRYGGSSDGLTAGAYQGYEDGVTVAYLPNVVYAPNAQFSRVTVLNVDTAAANIYLEYFNRDGARDFIVSDSIPAGGARTYDLHIPGPKVPDFSTTQYWTTNGHWSGSLKITSSNGKKIAAVVTNHWQQWAVAYNGIGYGGINNFVPAVERRCTPPCDPATGTCTAGSHLCSGRR